MAATFDFNDLLKRATIERQKLASQPQRVMRGTGDAQFEVDLQAGDAGFVDYTDPNSAVSFSLNGQTGNAGQFATFDPATRSFRVAQGDATSGIQRFAVNEQGTTDLGFEDIDRNAKFNRGAATLAAIGLAGAGGAYAAGLMGTAGGAGAGAAAGAGTGAAAGGAAAGGAASLLTPTNALVAGSLLSSTMQARQQASAMDAANASNERIASDQAAAAERTRVDAEAARQRALAAGGSALARTPDGMASARNRNRGGSGSTMLTGSGGVSRSSLSLGGPTLLGRLA